MKRLQAKRAGEEVDDAIPDVFKEFEKRYEEPVVVYPGHGTEGLIDQIDAAEKKLRPVQKLNDD